MTDNDWQDVLDAQGNQRVRPEVRLQGGSLDAEQVSATLVVSEHAAGPVEFGDNLYGATAWAPGEYGWRRVDTAHMRLMIAPMLQPGERAEISLPLDGAHDQVRVLLGAMWVDLRRR